MKIFISYSHKDKKFVQYLEYRLQSELKNIQIIRDEKVNTNFIPSMLKVPNCNFYLPVISKKFIESAKCQLEMSNAIVRYTNKGIPKILPIIIEELEDDFPEILESFVFYKLFTSYLNSPPSSEEKDIFNNEFNRIIKIIHEVPIKNDYFDFTHSSWSFQPNNEIIIKVNTSIINISSKNKTISSAIILTFQDWIDFTGYSTFSIITLNTNNCNFNGWSVDYPKMLKVEIDGKAIKTENTINRVFDDDYYLIPLDDNFIFQLPINKNEDNRKFEIVIGPGSIENLCIQIKFNR